MSVGENIKQARKRAGLSQTELGNLIGVTGQAIGQFEKKDTQLRADTIQKIADALKIDVRALTYVPREERQSDSFKLFLEDHGILLTPMTIGGRAGVEIAYDGSSWFHTDEEMDMIREYQIEMFKLLNEALNKLDYK